MTNLKNYICLVTGASRGLGREIAVSLGECGATVYVTGRTLNIEMKKEALGSLEETCAAIDAGGGKGIPVLVDHSNENEVTELFLRIRREQCGRLDVLVNNAYSAVSFVGNNMKKAAYEIDDCSPGEAWDIVNNVGLRNVYVCSVLAARMMLDYRKQTTSESKSSQPGLILNLSSFGGKSYVFTALYGIGKCAVDRMTKDMAREFKWKSANLCVISLYPGLVRTENILALAKEESAKDSSINLAVRPETSQSPELSGRAVAALSAESPAKLLQRNGQIVLVSDVAREYGIREVDGSVPTDYRSLRTLLYLGGYWLARFVPGFIRLPKLVFLHCLDWRPWP